MKANALSLTWFLLSFSLYSSSFVCFVYFVVVLCLLWFVVYDFEKERLMFHQMTLFRALIGLLAYGGLADGVMRRRPWQAGPWLRPTPA